MRPRTARATAAFLFFGVFVFGFLAMLPAPVGYVFMALFAVDILAMFIILIAFWRCTSCGHHLPTQGIIMMEYCPHCGAELE